MAPLLVVPLVLAHRAFARGRFTGGNAPARFQAGDFLFHRVRIRGGACIGPRGRVRACPLPSGSMSLFFSGMDFSPIGSSPICSWLVRWGSRVPRRPQGVDLPPLTLGFPPRRSWIRPTPRRRRREPAPPAGRHVPAARCARTWQFLLGLSVRNLQRGPDRTGRDRIDPDAARGQLHREPLGEGFDCRLGRGIVEDMGDGS